MVINSGSSFGEGEIAKPEDFNVEAISFQSRTKIQYEAAGIQKKIMEKIGEEEPVKEEKPAEAPEPIAEEKKEKEPDEEGAEEPPEGTSGKPVKKVEELIKGPLPEKEPEELGDLKEDSAEDEPEPLDES